MLVVVCLYICNISAGFMFPLYGLSMWTLWRHNLTVAWHRSGARALWPLSKAMYIGIRSISHLIRDDTMLHLCWICECCLCKWCFNNGIVFLGCVCRLSLAVLHRCTFAALVTGCHVKNPVIGWVYMTWRTVWQLTHWTPGIWVIGTLHYFISL